MNGPTRENPGVSPLIRWAGSKRKLLPELMKYVPTHYSRYIEPFSGSACLFFTIRPKSAVLSDLNRELIDTYRTVRLHPVLVHRVLAAMPVTERQYYYIRDNQNPSELDAITRAVRFLYLNRNCFNGVYRTNRAGQFNVPLGTRLGAIPGRLQFVRCAQALKRAELLDGDFEPIIAKAKRGDFVYLDPPYAKRGARKRGEYGYSSFDTPDVKRLSKCLNYLDTIGATFLLSYADCDEIRQLRSDWASRVVFVRRHVAGFLKHRSVVRELLISNRVLAQAPKSC